MDPAPALQQLIDALRESSRAQLAQETSLRECRNDIADFERRIDEKLASFDEKLVSLDNQIGRIVHEMDITNEIRRTDQEFRGRVVTYFAKAAASKPALVLYLLLAYYGLQVLGLEHSAQTLRAWLFDSPAAVPTEHVQRPQPANP